MYILRILYVALPCFDPDWEGTVKERTRTYLVATLGQERNFVPYAFRRYRSGDVTRKSTNPLCYYAASLWTNTERLRSLVIHSSQ